jgi:hypothetical protein
MNGLEGDSSECESANARKRRSWPSIQFGWLGDWRCVQQLSRHWAYVRWTVIQKMYVKMKNML